MGLGEGGASGRQTRGERSEPRGWRFRSRGGVHRRHQAGVHGLEPDRLRAVDQQREARNHAAVNRSRQPPRPHNHIFRKEGHQDAVCELKASVGAGWVILDILGGLLPVIVDAATGAWKSLDAQTCNVSLLKDPGGATVPKGKSGEAGGTE